jgi:hypothetical protein
MNREELVNKMTDDILTAMDKHVKQMKLDALQNAMDKVKGQLESKKARKDYPIYLESYRRMVIKLNALEIGCRSFTLEQAHEIRRWLRMHINREVAEKELRIGHSTFSWVWSAGCLREMEGGRMNYLIPDHECLRIHKFLKDLPEEK